MKLEVCKSPTQLISTLGLFKNTYPPTPLLYLYLTYTGIYGDSFLLLKPAIKSRCTFSDGEGKRRRWLPLKIVDMLSSPSRAKNYRCKLIINYHCTSDHTTINKLVLVTVPIVTQLPPFPLMYHMFTLHHCLLTHK